MRLSDGEQRQMEARLAVRYAAAGAQTQAWLEEQLSALSLDCALLTRWCYSASPLSDWANYDLHCSGPVPSMGFSCGSIRLSQRRCRRRCFSIMCSIRA